MLELTWGSPGKAAESQSNRASIFASSRPELLFATSFLSSTTNTVNLRGKFWQAGGLERGKYLKFIPSKSYGRSRHSHCAAARPTGAFTRCARKGQTRGLSAMQSDGLECLLYVQLLADSGFRSFCLHCTGWLHVFLRPCSTQSSTSKNPCEQEHVRDKKSTSRHHQHCPDSCRNGFLENG